MTSEDNIKTSMIMGANSLSSKKFHRYQYAAAISVSLGAFCAGTVLSWSSPGLPHILLTNKTNASSETDLTEPYPGFTITEQESAFIGSMLTIGALISAIPSGYLADKFGRKITILGLSTFFFINWILLSSATNLHMVLTARFFAGMGLGGICVTAPMYIGEIAEASNRGTFGSFFQLFLSCGILFTCVVGYFTNWLGLALVLGITPVLFGSSFLFMPETPIYLASTNKLEKARKNLKLLRGSSCNIAAELKSIQSEIVSPQKKASFSLSDFMTKANLRAVISIVGVLAFQQLSGINAIVFYTVTIFETAGTSMSPFLSAIIINLVQVLVSYLSMIIIEKANRKFYLIMSSTGMMICLAVLGMFFHLKYLNITSDKIASLPLGSTILYMVCFSIGYGPVPWMLLSELFAPEIKGVASGMAILVNWIFAFIVTLSFPIMNVSLGEHITFYIFAALMALGTVFVHFVVPETRGKTLVEIQEKLGR